MSLVVLVGTQPELLDSVVAALEGAGFAVQLASSMDEATERIGAALPIALVVERQLAIANAAVFTLPLLPGGAFFLYRTADDTLNAIPPGLARSTMAELTLPLERQRLTALVQRVRERHRVRRGDLEGSPETHPS